MQVEQAGGIYFGDDDPFLQLQTSCQSRRLGIPKGLGMLGLWLFTVYHPGNRVAGIRKGYRSVCGCLVVRWRSGVCVRKMLTRQSTADKLPALNNRVHSS